MDTPSLEEGSAADAGLDPDQLDRIRERAAQWVSEERTQAIVVVAARHGKVALHEAFGKLTPEPDSPPIRRDSLFPISSLSKPVTATVLMMLVERGVVGIHDRAIDHIPELAAAGPNVKQILIRHLLTHTSGYDDMDVMAFQARSLKEKMDLPALPGNQHKTIHLVLNARYGCPLTRSPGELMSYCTHGYELIAEIIRRASGKSLADLAMANIFEPLGMTDSSFRLEGHFDGRFVKRKQTDNPFGVDLNDERYYDTPWGGGGMNSTALDMARFGQFCLNGGRYGPHRLLSSNSLRTMTTNQIPPGVPENDMMRNIPQGSYGFGFFVFGDHLFPYNGAIVPKAAYSHAGLGGAMLVVDPQNDLVTVMLHIMEFDEGAVPLEDPPKLHIGKFFDMATAAVC